MARVATNITIDERCWPSFNLQRNFAIEKTTVLGTMRAEQRKQSGAAAGAGEPGASAAKPAKRAAALDADEDARNYDNSLAKGLRVLESFPPNGRVWLGEQLTVLYMLGIVLVVAGPADARSVKPFDPQYAEGYFYALLSAVGFVINPMLIGMAFETKGVAVGIAGGFVSYVAATAAIALTLAVPGQWRSFRTVDRESAKWFIISGIAVCLSQMFRYMALAIAPVSVVTPIQRLSLIFRIHFCCMLNPHHEVFGGRLILGTMISLAGAIALSLSTDSILHAVQLPAAVVSLLTWHWP
jgi:uncharacterized membrane protein